MTPVPADIWHLIQDTRQKMLAARTRLHTATPPQALFDEFGLTASPPFMGMLPYILSNYDRTALSTAHYRVRNSYNNPKTIDRILSSMAADGLLDTSGDTYHLSEIGQRFFSRLLETLRPRWQIAPEMDADVQRIISLMQRLIEATASTPEPPGKWAFNMRREKGFKRPTDTALLEQFDWHIFDLWAYRDDVHLASWAAYPVSPFAWEALTNRWTGKWDTLENLTEALKSREFTAEEWAVFVAESVKQGWMTAGQAGTYALTEHGTSVRQRAEQDTDACFYAPWSCLAAGELAELRGLLTGLRDKFAAIAAG